MNMVPAMKNPAQKYRVLVFISLLSLFVVYISTYFMLPFSFMEDNTNYGHILNSKQCKIRRFGLYERTITKYLVSSYPQCKPSYPILAFKEGLKIRLHHALIQEHYSSFSGCRYVPIVRRNMTSDKGFRLLDDQAVDFKNDLIVRHEFVKVTCFNGQSLVYTDYFAFILPKYNFSTTYRNETGNKISILLVGHDGVSHNTFVRSFPKLRSRLLKLGAVELQAYTKVGENTFPNMLGLMLGKTINEIQHAGWNTSQTFDQFDFLWEKFKRNGYTTSWAEDGYLGGGFNYLQNGFAEVQADYYYRPFTEAYMSDESVWSTPHCINDRYEISMSLDYISSFIKLYQNVPFFAMTFSARVTHSTIEYTNMIEEPNIHFLEEILKLNLTNTAIFYFADHGQRVGGIRETKPGRLEDKLPAMYILLPPIMEQQYPNMVDNLRENAMKLTCTWDVHKTLLHLLRLSGSDESFDVDKDRGVSLLEVLPFERSCKDAGIPQRYCPCGDKVDINTEDPIVQTGAGLAINALNSKIQEAHGLCENHTLSRVQLASTVMQQSENATVYIIVINTIPGDNVFDVTFLYDVENGISMDELPLRTNVYGDKSYCVRDVVLKTICLCKGYSW